MNSDCNFALLCPCPPSLSTSSSDRLSLVYCSTGFCQLTGLTPHHSLPYSLSSGLDNHGDDTSLDLLCGTMATRQERLLLAHALHSSTEVNLRINYVSPINGANFPCQVDLVPIRNESGAVNLLLVALKALSPGEDVVETEDRVADLPSGNINNNNSNKETVLLEPNGYLNLARGTSTCPAADFLTLPFVDESPRLEGHEENAAKVCPPPRSSLRMRRASPDQSSDDERGEIDEEQPKKTGHSRPVDDDTPAELVPSRYGAPTISRRLQNMVTSPMSSRKDTAETPHQEDERHMQQYRRRRRGGSQSVFFLLASKFDKEAKKKKKLNRFKNLSGEESMAECKVDDVRKPVYIVLHYSVFKIAWDWLILLCTLYIAILVPYHAAFSHSHNEGLQRLFVCDMLVELLFITDIILNFLTTFVNKAGQVVVQPQSIVLNYLRGWFLLDLTAAIPFELITLMMPDDTKLNSKIQLMKLARLIRLGKLVQRLDRYSQYSTVVLVLLMSMFTLCAHWMACIWYVIGWRELQDQNQTASHIGWLSALANKLETPYQGNLSGGPEATATYLTALYFTCSSLTSVGFGNVSANTSYEKLFSICAMLIGALMHAGVFGNVTAIINRMYAQRTAYQTRTKELKDFTRTHRISRELKHRIQDYFQTSWAMHRGIDANEIMKDFPEELRKDIFLYLHRDMLSLPLFTSLSLGCIKCLAQHICTTFSTPGEFLLHQGDPLKHIYYLCNGSLEILDDSGNVKALLGKGDLFGCDARAVEMPVRSAYEIKSLSYCDINTVDIRTLFIELEQYPQHKVEFIKQLEMELTYNLQDKTWDEDHTRNYDFTADQTTYESSMPNCNERRDSSSSCSSHTCQQQCPMTRSIIDQLQFLSQEISQMQQMLLHLSTTHASTTESTSSSSSAALPVQARCSQSARSLLTSCTFVDKTSPQHAHVSSASASSNSSRARRQSHSTVLQHTCDVHSSPHVTDVSMSQPPLPMASGSSSTSYSGGLRRSSASTAMRKVSFQLPSGTVPFIDDK